MEEGKREKGVGEEEQQRERETRGGDEFIEVGNELIRKEVGKGRGQGETKWRKSILKENEKKRKLKQAHALNLSTRMHMIVSSNLL